MALKITASDLFSKRYLAVTSSGVTFCEGMIGGTRTFRYRDIDAILLSPELKLSFQVGSEVFSIPMQMGNEKHQAVMDSLVYEVKRAHGHNVDPE